jgi:hypothetical protein
MNLKNRFFESSPFLKTGMQFTNLNLPFSPGPRCRDVTPPFSHSYDPFKVGIEEQVVRCGRVEGWDGEREAELEDGEWCASGGGVARIAGGTSWLRRRPTGSGVEM